MIEIQSFTNIDFGEVKGFCDDQGNSWLCLSDVCKALGISNPSIAKRRCNPNGVQLVQNVPFNHTNQWGNTEQVQYSDAYFINEPNFYRLIATSRTPEAVKFQDWVYDEVLPSIRKTGGYITPDVLDYLRDHPEEFEPYLEMQEKLRETEARERELRENYGALQENYNKLETVKKRAYTQLRNTRTNLGEARREISRDAPKVEYYNSYLGTDFGKTATQMASLFGFRSAQQFNEAMCLLGIIWRVNSSYVLHSGLVDKGYAKSRGTLSSEYGYQELLWTPKGEIFIWEVLKDWDFPVLPSRSSVGCC